MKVCILTTVHPPFDTRIFHKQAKTLVEAGYDVTLIAQHERDEVVDGVRIIALPRPRNRFQRIFGLTWRVFRMALRQQADVYHFHDPELLPAGVLLRLFTGKKVIYDVHEDYPRSIRTKLWLPSSLRGLIAVTFGGFERLLARSVDRVITATDEISRRFSERKTVVVKNYPILTSLKSLSSDPRLSQCLNQNDFTLIYVGVLTEIRGIYELVKALEFIDEKYKVRLKLLGKFTDQDFPERVRFLTGFAKVDFLGWVPYEEVYQHLREADVGFVLFHPVSNHIRSMPNKLFEYMAAGLPIIASNFPLWKEIVEGNECGLTVNPLNPKGIAEAIEYFLEHREERREMGVNGQRAVRDKYNWEGEASKLLASYGRVLRS